MSKRFPSLTETTVLSIPTVDSQRIHDELQQLRERLTQMSRQIELDPAFTSITVFNKGVQRHIQIADIMMIRSESNYSRFYLTDEPEILSCRTLKYWYGEITHPDIKRTHASYMINIKHIVEVDKKQSTILLKNGYMAKVSRRYKAFF